MKPLIIIFLGLCLGCNFNKDGRDTSQDWLKWSSESFFLSGRKVQVEQMNNRQSDSFKIVCYDQTTTYLELYSEVLAGYIKIQNIIGDSIPELIIDNCFACEIEDLEIYTFRKDENLFKKIPGTDSLCAEIYNIGNGLFYDSFCHNTGGCESTLFKLSDDSCFRIAHLFIPYSEDSVELTVNLRNPRTQFLPQRPEMSTDSLVPFLWNRFISGSRITKR
jgi:hypothetical protein